ncbi:hypothetical protein Nepgr_019568 [Nepenthes gracilis]|uniref:Uncharacterized protein n=1 Tax=Nepenthes gracilis TaxID=150966 RepID=A0AAD3XU90_NEPGR|nr:hypothetical protein Nepgr_019568 [Nepenthes gracilis]
MFSGVKFAGVLFAGVHFSGVLSAKAQSSGVVERSGAIYSGVTFLRSFSELRHALFRSSLSAGVHFPGVHFFVQSSGVLKSEGLFSGVPSMLEYKRPEFSGVDLAGVLSAGDLCSGIRRGPLRVSSSVKPSFYADSPRPLWSSRGFPDEAPKIRFGVSEMPRSHLMCLSPFGFLLLSETLLRLCCCFWAAVGPVLLALAAIVIVLPLCLLNGSSVIVS